MNNSVLAITSKVVMRQVKFPSLIRALIESALFCGVFLAAGHISLDLRIVDMLVPMVPVVLIMMLSMVASGVYRPEVTLSIIKMNLHSAYGFVLASIVFVSSVPIIASIFANLKFQLFFLFFSFFVINTLRPILCGTDFMDGGGRRVN